ncbi:MAG TPA: transglutaminase family protein [Rhodocyclaceae bacterium]|nr:transglutaminase family protein [Rhodocyclaceae bacterium]HRQ47341.1 transglutaminase family protein [Rhodocyclaceae bacterium]
MSKVSYHVRHETLYHYDQPVGESHQLLRLAPRELAWQRCVGHRIEVRPEPSRFKDFVDSFGNTVRALHFDADHDSLFVHSESWVELDPRPTHDLESSPAWESVRDALRYRAGKRIDSESLQATAFLFESTDVRLKRDFGEYARPSFAPERPVLAAVDDLMQRIFREFSFDPEATDVSTPVTEVYANRRGVCQDFAHFMISCLRTQGIPARYVSGYILTRPPPGKKRLVGADATHAWVSVFCPDLGWIDFDPTNAVRPDLEHITIGWGRDFSDISPMRGVLLGGGGHEPEIAVTVVPEAEFTDLYSDPGLPSLALRFRNR